MSMDEQFYHMTEFHKELRQFNQTVHDSWREVERLHEQMSPQWNDEFRRNHDAVWEALNQRMRAYLSHEGPNYIDYLAQKRSALERYLRGV